MNTVTDTLQQRDDIGVHVVHIDGGQASVELTRMAWDHCLGCGQHLNTTHPGPVEWIDPHTGRVQGGYSHQHGCGTWNTPRSVRTEVADDPGTIDAAAEGLLADLDAAVDTEAEEDTTQLEVRLHRALSEVRAQIGADPDGDETDHYTGSDTNPGVYRDDSGDLVAWDYHPLASVETSRWYGETLVVTA